MLKLDIAFIPEAHIMKRWTRDARDVLPGDLKVYQKDQTKMQSMTFRHRLMYLDALGLVKKGDIDIELFEIVNDHLKRHTSMWIQLLQRGKRKLWRKLARMHQTVRLKSKKVTVKTIMKKHFSSIQMLRLLDATTMVLLEVVLG
jgi:hypothetical protein